MIKITQIFFSGDDLKDFKKLRQKLKALKKGDVLVMDDVNDFNNLDDFIIFIKLVNRFGLNFISHNDFIDTTQDKTFLNAIDKLVKKNIGQFRFKDDYQEKLRIKRESFKSAAGWNKINLDEQLLNEVYEQYLSQELSPIQCAEKLGVSLKTFYRRIEKKPKLNSTKK